MEKEFKSSPPPNLIKGIMVFPTVLILLIAIINYRGKISVLIALTGLLILYFALKISVHLISKRWIFFKVIDSILYVKNKDQHWVPFHELKQHVSVEVSERSVCILYEKDPERHYFEDEQFEALLEYLKK